MNNDTLKKILCVLLALLVALASFLPIARWASRAETYSGTIETIDDKIDTVMKLTAAATLASAGISAIPGDMATPIAEQMAEYTDYFLLILCALYLEKYLLSIIGLGAFKLLIPAACGMFIIGLFWNGGTMKKLAMKLFVLAVALFATIPGSFRVSELVYDTYQESIDATIAEAEQLTADTSELSGEEDQGAISGLLKRLGQSASDLADRAAKTLNRFVETLAVLIVTSCLIPILSLLFFLWIIKIITGIDIPAPMPRLRHKPGPGEGPAP